MKRINQDSLNKLLKREGINQRVLSKLRTKILDDLDWNNLDFFTLTNKSKKRGLLIYQSGNQVLIRSYSIRPKPANLSGQNKPMVCDICRTWRRGSSIGFMTITKSQNQNKEIGNYVCFKLDCSLHVRDMTPQSKLSKTQIREDLDRKAKIVRLNRNLKSILTRT